MLLKVRIKYLITALLLTSALCIGLTAPYLGRAELILLTTSLVVINSLLALLAIKECYVPVLTALVIELVTSPLALPTKYVQVYVALATLATSVIALLIHVLRVGGGGDEVTYRRYLLVVALALLTSLGVIMSLVALTYQPPPDLFRVAKSLAERRLITWRVLGVLAGVLNLLAAYYVLKGRLIHYILCVGIFLSPLILATQSLPKPSVALWAQLTTFLITYVLGALALRSRY